jgi:hypothetical protein
MKKENTNISENKLSSLSSSAGGNLTIRLLALSYY